MKIVTEGLLLLALVALVVLNAGAIFGFLSDDTQSTILWSTIGGTFCITLPLIAHVVHREEEQCRRQR